MTPPTEAATAHEETRRPFEFVGGRLCLDFTNTVTWTADGLESERLRTPADLADWGVAAGALDDEQASRLRALDALDPPAAAALMSAARALRAALHGVFVALAAGRGPDPDDVAALNAALSRAARHLRLGAEGSRFFWEWAPDAAPDAAPDRVLWHVAWSAANLLAAGEELARVRACGSEDCGWLYVDESRNRSRRWCEMKSCGNRAKARRHYERRRARKLDPGCASPER